MSVSLVLLSHRYPSATGLLTHTGPFRHASLLNLWAPLVRRAADTRSAIAYSRLRRSKAHPWRCWWTMKSWCRDLGGNEALKTTAGAFTSAVMPGWAVERHSFVTSVRTELCFRPSPPPAYHCRSLDRMGSSLDGLVSLHYPFSLRWKHSYLAEKIISVKSSWSQTYFFKFWWLTVDRVVPLYQIALMDKEFRCLSISKTSTTKGSLFRETLSL